MERKKSVGLFLTGITVILAVIGIICYMVNCNTNYFKNLGVSTGVCVCGVLAILCEVVFLVVGMKDQPMWADILPVAGSVCLILSALNVINVRVNGIAAIMTFENNANNMADLQSAIISMAFLLCATVVAMIASFFDITKEA